MVVAGEVGCRVLVPQMSETTCLKAEIFTKDTLVGSYRSFSLGLDGCPVTMLANTKKRTTKYRQTCGLILAILNHTGKPLFLGRKRTEHGFSCDKTMAAGNYVILPMYPMRQNLFRFIMFL